jgi:hypothetical protein
LAHLRCHIIWRLIQPCAAYESPRRIAILLGIFSIPIRRCWQR